MIIHKNKNNIGIYGQKNPLKKASHQQLFELRVQYYHSQIFTQKLAA